MLIQETCQKCNLTKKAVEYYEAKGLISPEILENGYRNYSDEDIHALKEISVLRRFGISVADISDIVNSKNKSAALAKYRYIAEIRMSKLQAIQQCMDNLIHNYDVEKEFSYLQLRDEDLFTIKEKLVFAFPGNYGMFISLHFGRFLDGLIDSEEKRIAYYKVVDYLDHLDLSIPEELSAYLSEIFETVDIVQLENSTNAAMLNYLEDSEDYLAKHQEQIEAYHSFLRSEEFLKSPAALMQKKLLDFQSESGYKENLITNIMVLSPSYKDYVEKLEAANVQFLNNFPNTEELYGLE